MANKKINITVGIPAYNEGLGISDALISILSQKSENFILKEIIVASDASTDNTIGVVKGFNKKSIRIISAKERKGKAYRLNQIFKLSKSEILVLMDADCTLKKGSLELIANAFLKDRKCSLVAGNASPQKPQTFVEEVVNVGVEIKKSIYSAKNANKKVYQFHGSLMALRKNFYKKIHMPSIPGTDAYLYFKAISENLGVKYLSNANVYYLLPNKIIGHFKQSTRFNSSQRVMSEIFGDWVNNEYRIPKTLLAKETFKEFVRKPLLTSTYLLTNFVVKLKYWSSPEEASGVWDVALSTKRRVK